MSNPNDQAPTRWFEITELSYVVAVILVVGGLAYAVANHNSQLIQVLSAAGVGFLFGRRAPNGS